VGKLTISHRYNLYYIAPLQPFTLAAIKPWGSSKGAGRIGLTRRKSTTFYGITKVSDVIF